MPRNHLYCYIKKSIFPIFSNFQGLNSPRNGFPIWPSRIGRQWCQGSTKGWYTLKYGWYRFASLLDLIFFVTHWTQQIHSATFRLSSYPCRLPRSCKAMPWIQTVRQACCLVQLLVPARSCEKGSTWGAKLWFCVLFGSEQFLSKDCLRAQQKPNAPMGWLSAAMIVE